MSSLNGVFFSVSVRFFFREQQQRLDSQKPVALSTLLHHTDEEKKRAARSTFTFCTNSRCPSHKKTAPNAASRCKYTPLECALNVGDVDDEDGELALFVDSIVTPTAIADIQCRQLRVKLDSSFVLLFFEKTKMKLKFLFGVVCDFQLLIGHCAETRANLFVEFLVLLRDEDE